MRFMLLFKSDAQTEAGATPSAATIEAIGAYNESLVRSGAFVAAEGLHPSSQGVRMALTDGERSLVRGPFPNPDQIIAGYWLVDAPSLADAVALAQRCPFEKCGAAGEIEVRPLESNEAPPDVPTPAGPDGKPLKRFFTFVGADAVSEAGTPGTPEHYAAMGAFIGEAIANGRFAGGDGLRPSSHGARVRYREGLRQVIDGPFAETKELVAGYAILFATDLAEAIDFGWRFLAVDAPFRRGHAHIEVRELYGPDDFPA